MSGRKSHVIPEYSTFRKGQLRLWRRCFRRMKEGGELVPDPEDPKRFGIGEEPGEKPLPKIEQPMGEEKYSGFTIDEIREIAERHCRGNLACPKIYHWGSCNIEDYCRGQKETGKPDISDETIRTYHKPIVGSLKFWLPSRI